MREPSTEQLIALQTSCDACFGTPAVWPVVARAYREPQRHYHTLVHIGELLTSLAPFRTDPLWPAIELAVWGHDAVYATHLPDYAENEARSAAWLVHLVSEQCPAAWRHAHAAHVSLATNVILATKQHRVPESLANDPRLRRVAQLFLDADLAILAAPAQRLIEYDRDIAREWAQDPDAPAEAFRDGRYRALLGLRAHAPLFHSNEFAALEPLAHANLDVLIRRYALPRE
ncbi:HD domain-containing protein [Paraburkholderia acidisoli]|uniref:Metal-dependent HD superfamily phosphohydrolase n=1 Tax=Paraburkholderia acidisoli TaxID=2571748 RepID=A0A7Z2JHY2_9BURK|nr:hypothetical protein [Paraburkholderia acidisoli]QGZ64583.1 hypothetical protein FAZ98_22335 [Paraburkholderia acidisoli]